MMNKNYCVYEHIFPNGKKYIGISCDAEKRWRNGKGYETQPKIARAINKYGWENIEHNIIVDGISKEQAGQLERYLIAELDTIENGYNNAIGGENINSTYLNEHVLQMIRDSKKYDEIYNEVQGEDSIVTIAETAKNNKKLAEIINRADELVRTKYNEYLQYFGRHTFHDFGMIRCDCYWWTLAKVLVNDDVLKEINPYWKVYISQFDIS